MVLDVPARWLMDIGDTFVGNRGYVALGTVSAAYVAVFGLIDAKSTQEQTQASLERSQFITLVSAGNPASFVAATKGFGPTQTIRATKHPDFLRFWHWDQTYQPNMDPLWQWALWRLELCNRSTKDCALDDNARIDLSRADLHDAHLRDTRLRDADLSRADLRGSDLSGASLSDAILWGAQLGPVVN